MLLQMAGFPSLLLLSNIPLCLCGSVCMWDIYIYIYIYILLSIHPSINICCFHILAIVSNAAMNMKKRFFFQNSDSIFFRYIPRSGIAESYGSFVFNFLRNLHAIFHNGSSNLHSHQQCKSVAFSPHLWQHLSLAFLILALLTGVRWYLVTVLTCIFLMISDIMYYLDKCIL